jgi:uncharacterized damage-inducible protein DinB
MPFKSPVDRADIDRLAGELDALGQQLDFQRATLLVKLDGLDDEQLRRPMTPSGLSLLGLVKHLAATEHGWFLNRYAGLPDSPPFGDDPDEDFRIGPDETTDGIVDAYLRTCQRAREVVSGGDLDAVMHLAEGPAGNVRALMLHMIQETARHAGHADIMREEIDGTTGI